MRGPLQPERIPEALELAWQLLDNGELDEAQKIVGKVLIAGPKGEDAIDAYHLRGELLLERWKPREALLSLDTAAKGMPGDAHILAAKGDALFMLWQFDKAKQAHEAALRADTRHARAHRGMALALDRLGKHRIAAMHFERASDLEPGVYAVPPRLARPVFDRHARDAIDALPDEVKERLGPIGFLVADYPALAMIAEQPEEADPETLGLFFGEEIPARYEERGLRFVPNHIHLFQRNLENISVDEDDLEEEIRTTVYHEVGHYLGYDEEGLDEIGLA